MRIERREDRKKRMHFFEGARVKAGMAGMTDRVWFWYCGGGVWCVLGRFGEGYLCLGYWGVIEFNRLS